MINVDALNEKQKTIYSLYKDVPGFDMEAALAGLASKPKGRPPKASQAKNGVKPTNEFTAREGKLVIELLELQNCPVEKKRCQQCNEFFMANYKSVALCSDPCRADWLKAQYGLDWNYEKSEIERWGVWYQPPSIITPETLKKLQRFARRILQISERLDDSTQANDEVSGVAFYNGMETNPREENTGGNGSEREITQSPRNGREQSPTGEIHHLAGSIQAREQFRQGLISAAELIEILKHSSSSHSG